MPRDELHARYQRRRRTRDAAPEYQPRMSLAHQSPAAPDVLKARAETPGPARWSSSNAERRVAGGYGRPRAGWLRRHAPRRAFHFKDDYLTRIALRARRDLVAVSPFPAKAATRLFVSSRRWLPRSRAVCSTSATWTSSSRRTPSSARCVHSRSPPRRIAAAAPDRVAARVRVFGKDVEHVTSRRSPPDNAAPSPSILPPGPAPDALRAHFRDAPGRVQHPG